MSRYRYCDIGINLFCRQFKDHDEIVDRAAEHGVACILTGSDMTDVRLINRYTEEHDVWGTAGIHPHNADRAKPEDMDELERILTSNPKIVAVGECGLDYDRMFSSRENQVAWLKRHIDLAEKTGKPMFLHVREAADDFLRCFEDHPELRKRSVVHCFTDGIDTLRRYLDAGFYIGITGWICDPRRGDALREAVKELPLDRVMLETDAPYLIPRNVKGLKGANVPENIVYVARDLALSMGVEEETLISAALNNTCRFFGITL